MNTLTILYATDELTSRLHETHAARNWEVFCPTDLNEALALSVFYTPHAIVVDGDSDWLNELTANLANVTGPSARMHDIVVRLADTALNIDVPDFITYVELPSDTTPDELAHTLSTLDLQRERNGRLMPEFAH